MAWDGEQAGCGFWTGIVIVLFLLFGVRTTWDVPNIIANIVLTVVIIGGLTLWMGRGKNVDPDDPRDDNYSDINW